MCVVSMVMDHYADKWNQQIQTLPTITYWPPQITQAELDEFHQFLERAREYDKRNNEPLCEMESKKARVRKLAEKLGVKVDFI